jgi:Protein of unknown function (DUF1573)
MRHLLTGCLIAALTAGTLTGCHNADRRLPATIPDPNGYTTIKWLDSSKDYGKISEGQQLDVAFRFRNTGGHPLVITRVQPSCGCTIAEQPQAPIAPGSEGQIRATFNSQGRTGVNHKTLFVNANTSGHQSWSLNFVVVVEKKAS